ncbi:riboflavin kinase [Megalopta genalis]|uniref:riboflavin kinase n=1 Tax=Megalopta genalis TaxID=115081 RepID=UPI0014431C84|nr:riboflavin kinase [Megalopta genalis]XP_033340963.1 riboflavin kinase [Megalopta genalis]
MYTESLPLYLTGLVVKGFGRGSKALGIPTANLEEKVVEALPSNFNTGVYYGWASLDGKIYKMVASIGWNPFYKNEKKTVEVHMLHKFENDLYGQQIKVIFVGYIRPEQDFSSIEELITAINNDISVAEKQLEQPPLNIYKNDKFLKE